MSATASNWDRIGKPFNPLLGETYQLDRSEEFFFVCFFYFIGALMLLLEHQEDHYVKELSSEVLLWMSVFLRGANALHIVQLMLLPLHHFLL